MSHVCYECEVLREFYWLKVNQFLLATRSPNEPHAYSAQVASEEEVQALKDEALGALSALIGHWKACYGLSESLAA